MSDELNDYTPEELDRIINGEDLEGDTKSKAEAESMEKASLPEAGSDNGEQSRESIDGEDHLTPDNAVVLAKDGKHTIDYQKLLDARQQAQEAKAQAEAARLELEQLKAEAQARAEAGQAATAVDNQVKVAQQAIENGVDPAVFGDFSEESLAKGVAVLVQQEVERMVEKRLAKELAPIKQREQQTEIELHYQTIRNAHHDADSIVDSQEFENWLTQQTSMARAAYQQVLQQGSAEQIIELFDAFKHSTNSQAAAGNDNPVKAAAKQAIENAKQQPPTSLSDFTGGRAASSKADAMTDMDGVGLLSEMEDMTPEQIEQFLNRL